jgi:hypothetical protein
VKYVGQKNASKMEEYIDLKKPIIQLGGKYCTIFSLSVEYPLNELVYGTYSKSMYRETFVSYFLQSDLKQGDA